MEIKPLSKKGVANASTDYIIGGLLAVLLVSVLANVIFDFVGNINTEATGGTAPNWLPTILVVGIAIGLFVVVFVAFGLMKQTRK